jgi:hypothetical protein
VSVELSEVRGVLCDELKRRRAALFMGAGFSSAALDPAGNPIPLGNELADELFAVCFPGEERDDSTLQDLFHHALVHHREHLEPLLRQRLTIDPGSLPEWYQLYFAQPWVCAWTLNVDLIEQAAAHRFPLPRAVRSISALSQTPVHPKNIDRSALNVVHLNGVVDDGCDRMTFATSQYGKRLAVRDEWYATLANDLLRQSFFFVGTRLDEAPLWQHLEARDLRQQIEKDDTPRSFLVTTKLDRARRCLLQDFAIEWVCASAEEFASEVLSDVASQ